MSIRYTTADWLYDSYTSKDFDTASTLFFYKGKWRNIISFEKLYDTNKKICTGVLIKFGGLTKPRLLSSGTEIPYSYKFDRKAIKEGKWFGQAFPLEQGLDEYASWKKEKIDEKIKKEELRLKKFTQEDWEWYWTNTQIQKFKRRKNNEEFFSRRYDKPKKEDRKLYKKIYKINGTVYLPA